MTQYVCLGYVITKDKKRGIQFRPYEDGKVRLGDEKDLVFAVDKNTDFPAGWILDIESHEGKFRGFKVTSSKSNVDEALLKEWQMNSIANVKELDLERLRAKEKSIREQIGKLTIDELKEYMKKSPSHRESVKFYLWELF